MDIRKLREYSLDQEHLVSGHKARVFAAALGLTAADAEWLRSVLLAIVATPDYGDETPSFYGQQYVIDFPLLSPTGRQVIVRSGWIIRRNEDFPRLTTCYVR